MPRVKIETSLFDPLIIELGEKVYTAVPRGIRLIKALEELKKKRTGDMVSELDFMTQILGLVFGVSDEEFAALDGTLLVAISEKATEYIGSGIRSKPKSDSGTTEAEAEKNVSTPGSEPSQ